MYLFQLSPPSGLNNWQKIKEKGYLTWVSRPSPLTNYNSLDGIVGLEYDILKSFCKINGIELVILNSKSNSELFAKLDKYNVDIAGANLTVTERRLQKYPNSIAYDQTYINLISSASRSKITNLDELNGLTGGVLKNSSYEEVSGALTQKNAVIKSFDNTTLYELLQMVTAGTIDYTFADSNIVAIYQAYIPKLRVGLKLSDMRELVFLYPSISRHDDSLKVMLDNFILAYKAENRVNKYKQRISDILPNSRPADTVTFLGNYNKRWLLIRGMVYETANKYSMSPILLGSISYQESHWNASAVSPTLVKGLMMLTKAVSKEQNVVDRLDPLQSLEGGAKHFLKMKKKIPQRIKEPDRTSFALAAYNLGYGHLEKARVITQRAGSDPDLWAQVKQFLPLLNDLEGIKADGKTAVRYVENIRVYQNLLQWKEQQ